MPNLNIAKFLMQSEIEGPGNRFVIWFQGCLIHCKGCSNDDLLSLEKRMFIPNELLYEKILEAKEKYNLEGLTLIGGEPFLQPDGLKELVEWAQKNNLTVICFTGYLYEKLMTEYEDILKNIDILIDGPFMMSKLDIKRRLIGSKNQRVLKLSKKYLNCDYFDQPYSEIEIQLYNNRLSMNGDGTVFDDNFGNFNFNLNKKEN